MRTFPKQVLTPLLIITSLSVSSQTDSAATRPAAAPAKKQWYELLSLRGYAQLRYNRLLETNDKFKSDAGDRTLGDNNEFSFRRARLVVSGQVHPRVGVYFQVDFAASAGSSNNFGQIRDLYADLGLDKDNEFRVRLGWSKVPFGFENLQSSRDRLPLDRVESLNSAVPGERDLGISLLWATKEKRELYKRISEEGLKGSGDYGLISAGVYNGQGTNRPEANDELHFFARITWPFEIGSQIVEPGVQGYSGHYVVTSDQRSAAVKGSTDFSYEDTRFAGSLVLYPKPFGLLAEYTMGKGPEYDAATDSITTRDLSGGFVTATCRFKWKEHVFFPFARVQVYDGARKNELDARAYSVTDVELGIEWQPVKHFELTAEYYIGDHRYRTLANEDDHQTGNLLRLQAQFNF